MLDWGPISQYILERTSLAHEIYICDRNQRAGHLRQVGKIARQFECIAYAVACVGERIASISAYVPVMQSSAVSGTWTQSNRYTCRLNRSNNKSVEGLGLRSVNPEKENRGSAKGVVHHGLNCLQIWWLAGKTKCTWWAAVFRPAFWIAHAPASPNKVRNWQE